MDNIVYIKLTYRVEKSGLELWSCGCAAKDRKTACGILRNEIDEQKEEIAEIIRQDELSVKFRSITGAIWITAFVKKYICG